MDKVRSDNWKCIAHMSKELGFSNLLLKADRMRHLKNEDSMHAWRWHFSKQMVLSFKLDFTRFSTACLYACRTSDTWCCKLLLNTCIIYAIFACMAFACMYCPPTFEHLKVQILKYLHLTTVEIFLSPRCQSYFLSGTNGIHPIFPSFTRLSYICDNLSLQWHGAQVREVPSGQARTPPRNSLSRCLAKYACDWRSYV